MAGVTLSAEGLGAAYLDADGDGKFAAGERVLKAEGAGPVLVDGKGTRYEAALDSSAAVRLEQAGPMRAVLRVEGWYVSKAGRKVPCRLA